MKHCIPITFSTIEQASNAINTGTQRNIQDVKQNPCVCLSVCVSVCAHTLTSISAGLLDSKHRSPCCVQLHFSLPRLRLCRIVGFVDCNNTATLSVSRSSRPFDPMSVVCDVEWSFLFRFCKRSGWSRINTTPVWCAQTQAQTLTGTIV